MSSYSLSPLAIKGTSAVGSGIRTIPYLVSITIAAVIIGGAITLLGTYYHFLWVGGLIFIAGCTTIHLLDVNSNIGRWFGFQVLTGMGAGSAVQIPFLAVQVALSPADVPVGSMSILPYHSIAH